MNNNSKDNTWFNKAPKRGKKTLIAQQKTIAEQQREAWKEFLFKIELMEKCKHIYFNH